jgi:hypothetical protein
MDSFYKLSPTQRTGMIIGSAVTSFVLIISVMLFYFSQVDALESELNESFNAIYELQQLKADYKYEDERFNNLLRMVRSKTSALRVKPFFEEKATTIGVELQGLSDQTEPLPAENVLSKKVKYVRVEMRIPKVSIPRLLNFMIEVEKSGNFLSVENLEIRSRYGTKLFFDATVKFRGYAVEGV